MKALQQKAINGKILVAKHIRKVIETKLGKPVSDDYIWDLELQPFSGQFFLNIKTDEVKIIFYSNHC
ncbi:MAG: hypothetical protein JSU07_09080 [Bacteroidetes bacterium]|nr:hypothetical protein [Bacteroidota bacterium]